MEAYVEEIAKYLLANKEEILKLANTKEGEAVKNELQYNLEALPIAAMKLLWEGQNDFAVELYKAGIEIRNAYLMEAQDVPYQVIASKIAGKLQNWSAVEVINRSLQARHKLNDVGHFFLGNACYHLCKMNGSLDAYEGALSINRNFQEAIANKNAVLAGQSIPYEEPTLCLASFEINHYKEIPIFINSRDRVGCLKELVTWLLNAGYKKIIIIDNASTYLPLLEYYTSLEDRPEIMLVKLNVNIGHLALWQAGILDALDIRTPYVYTDSDVVPEAECPRDLVRHLLLCMKRYPWLDKCGVGLRIDDVRNERIIRWERAYYRLLLDEDFFFAPIDTTFALYQGHRAPHIYISARSRGCYLARHLPWYYDENNTPEDELYYRARANSSSTEAETAKGNKSQHEHLWQGFF